MHEVMLELFMILSLSFAGLLVIGAGNEFAEMWPK